MTGTYTFWIASQDNGELWLSGSDRESGLVKVAEVSGVGASTAPREWTRYAGQHSGPIPLAAGYAYAIEALVKSNLRADMSAWRGNVRKPESPRLWFRDGTWQPDR